MAIKRTAPKAQEAGKIHRRRRGMGTLRAEDIPQGRCDALRYAAGVAQRRGATATRSGA